MKTFIQQSLDGLRLFIVFVSLSLAVSNCMDKVTMELLESFDFTRAVSEYNQLIAEQDPKHRAIIIPGDIRTEQHVTPESRERKLVLFITGNDMYRTYKFQYEMEQGEIDIPKAIPNGRIVYLGDNLVVQDIKHKKNYLFIIEGFENRVPELEPTMYGIGITSAIGSVNN